MGRLLLLLMLAVASLGLSAKDLTDLERDANAFRKQLLDKRSAGTPEQQAALTSAALIMAEAKQCGTARDLRLQAMRMGGAMDAAAWRALAMDAHCARDWELSARSNLLALRMGLESRRLQAWAELGHALESRSNWNNDWKPAALEAFEEVAKGSNADWLIKRIANLREAMASDRELRVESTRIDSEGPNPGLCVSFNESLSRDESQKVGDYVRVEPALGADVRVNWSELCIHGAAWSSQYTLTLLEGLAGERRSLPKHLELTFDTGERPAALWFDQSAYVLAASQQPEVPLHVINTPGARLQLLRVHERNILSDWVQDQFRSPLTGYEQESLIRRLGELVWQGEAETSGPANQDHEAWLELPLEVAESPGLYVLTARDKRLEDDNDWESLATQWLVVTDIGVTSYQGEDGLTLAVRRLSDARPLQGVQLTLMARNNEPLANLISDADGLARFPAGLLRGAGGREAVQVTAQGNNLGFTFLQLQQAAFDLSDRGVDGRLPPGPLDAYLYTERGVYRPGEAVNLTGLLRDQAGRSVAPLPLTLKLLNPSGDPTLQRVLQPDDTGAYASRIQLSEAADTGHWQLALYTDPKQAPLGSVSFLVEQIAPPRMEAQLTTSGVLKPGMGGEAKLKAMYLFGAPAAERPVRSELFVEVDPNPFPDWADYRFGIDGEQVESDWIELAEVTTDEEGNASLLPMLDGVPTPRVPLRARIRAEVMDVDGRVVSASSQLPIRHLPLYLGMDPLFDTGSAPADETLGVRLLALDAEGQAQALAGARWRLVREQWDYQWFRKNGQWAFERVLRESPSGEGRIDLSADGQTELALPVQRGDYRLELQDDADGVLSILRLHAGEQMLASQDTPDAVRMTLDRADYLPGDSAVLEFDSPFQGPASLVIAGETVHSIQSIQLDAFHGRVEIPVAHDWGAGAYALVTVYRPGASHARGAGRAIGVAWIGVRPQQHSLELTLDSDPVVRPNGEVRVPIQVRGQSPGERVHLTLAAVDEGVLSLTDFVSPDPLDHFFGKRRLGIGVRDLYGRLIARRGQRPDHLREGAGTSGRRGMPPSNVEIVSLFSGVVELDADGQASVPFALPDFNGRLRLMAVAWSRDKLGAGQRDLTVRDPVVVLASLPRFLALEDEGQLTVQLHNLSGPAGDYHLSLSDPRKVETLDGLERSFSLQAGGRHSETFALRAKGLGEGGLELTLAGPEGYGYSRHLKLGMRGRYLPVVERAYQTLGPGAELLLDASRFDGLFTDTAQLQLSVAATPALDVPGLLKELRHYPWGCLEQVTSRAMPLLYANPLAERWQLEVDPQRALQLQQMVQLVLDKQMGDGSFGLWSNRGDPEIWLSAYAMDFLVQAREAGADVSDYFIQRGIEWLTYMAGDQYAEDNDQLAARAYAHYVLARVGAGMPEELRYLFDNRLSRMPSSLALAQLGAALAIQGDQRRADEAFARARAQLDRKPVWVDYGSRIRDTAGVIVLLSEYAAGRFDTAQLWVDLVQRVKQDRWLSTQEKAWLLRAAMEIPAGRALDLAFNGVAAGGSGDWSVSLDDAALAPGARLTNKGQQPVYLTLGVEGTPITERPRQDQGFSIEREWRDLDGNRVDPADLQQGQLLMALIHGRSTTGEAHRALVVDLIPAGFEIENPRLSEALSPEDFAWLPQLSAVRFTDALDDRFAAALDLPQTSNSNKVSEFNLAYLLRVVTPGRFFAPPVEVEDMYRPRFRAAGVGRSLTIRGR